MYVWENGKREPTREAVARLRRQGRTQAEIARQLGLTKSTVAYHFRRIGMAPDLRFARRYDWATIQRAYDGGLSARECVKRFGFNKSSWSQAVARGDIVPRQRGLTVNELLVLGTRRGRENLKRRLVDAGLKDNRCELCGIDEWLGRPLSMQLHHVNGDGHDNRLENLQLLCPNCHSQTDTYGGRNGHRRRRAGEAGRA